MLQAYSGVLLKSVSIRVLFKSFIKSKFVFQSYFGGILHLVQFLDFMSAQLCQVCSLALFSESIPEEIKRKKEMILRQEEIPLAFRLLDGPTGSAGHKADLQCGEAPQALNCVKSSCCEMSFLSCWDGSKTTLSTKCVVCRSLTSLQSTVVCFGPNMPKLARIWRSPVSGAVWEACGKGKLRLNCFLINVWSSRILDLFEWLSIIKAQHLSLPF